MKEEIAKKRAELDAFPKTGDNSALKAQSLSLMGEFKECQASINALTAVIDKAEKEAKAPL